VKKRIAAAVLLAALISMGLWWFSPEQVLRRRTEKLVELFSLSEDKRGLKQMRVFAMNKMLCPQVELIIPDVLEANGSFDKAEIEAAFSWICQNATRSHFEIVSFRDVNVSGEKARLSFAAEGSIQFRNTGPVEGGFDVAIIWKKAEDGWHFEKVTCQKR
jgi:hypothetical protein